MFTFKTTQFSKSCAAATRWPSFCALAIALRTIQYASSHKLRVSGWSSAPTKCLAALRAWFQPSIRSRSDASPPRLRPVSARSRSIAAVLSLTAGSSPFRTSSLPRISSAAPASVKAARKRSRVNRAIASFSWIRATSCFASEESGSKQSVWVVIRRLTFELSGHQRQHARSGPVKMYGVPLARSWWPAVGAPLARGVRHRLGAPASIAKAPCLIRGCLARWPWPDCDMFPCSRSNTLVCTPTVASDPGSRLLESPRLGRSRRRRSEELRRQWGIGRPRAGRVIRSLTARRLRQTKMS